MKMIAPNQARLCTDKNCDQEHIIMGYFSDNIGIFSIKAHLLDVPPIYPGEDEDED